MKFYKIIKDEVFIGVVSSFNFFVFNPLYHNFLSSDEKEGQFISFNGEFYRDYWMKALPDYPVTYHQALIQEISEEEYNTINDAIQNEVEIVPQLVTNEEKEIFIQPISNEEIVDLDYLKSIKLRALSKQCNETIEAGFGLEIHNDIKHFSLNTQDQLNLISLSLLTRTQSSAPYHADGELCEVYTAREINEIVEAANKHKIYNTTYYNALKAYINSLTDAELISSIEYGDSIPEEFKTDILKALEN